MTMVLVADDERDIRELIAFTLRFAGYEVTTANDGEDAYQQALKIIPDLILLDVRMPRMTGYEACKAIKNNATLQHIPVMFLSAKGQEAEIQAGYDAGAIDYLLKPFAPDELTARVKMILSQIDQ
jgi:DNA-binding response OmpR family regulator